MVKDVNATIAYYREFLQFEFVMGVDANKLVKMAEVGDAILTWAIIKRNDVEIMLQSQNSLIEEVPEFKGRTVGGTFTLYISMVDVQGLYDKIKNKVEVIKELNKTFYGAYEFAIKDLNGYIIYFAEFQDE